jgi:hypothetical protein
MLALVFLLLVLELLTLDAPPRADRRSTGHRRAVSFSRRATVKQKSSSRQINTRKHEILNRACLCPLSLLRKCNADLREQPLNCGRRRRAAEILPGGPTLLSSVVPMA